MNEDISNFVWDDVKNRKQIVPHPKAPIKSYYADMENAMRNSDGGTMSKAIEEARAVEKKQKNESFFSRTNIVYLILSTLLFIFSVFAVGYVVLQTTNKEVSLVQEKKIESLIPADGVVQLNSTDASSFKIESLARGILTEQNPEAGSIIHIPFIHEEEDKLVFTDLNNFLTALEIELPIELTTVLQNKFMYGMYMGEMKTPFLVLKVASFDQAFRGLRAWESDMLDDLRGIFAIEQTRLTPRSFTEPFENLLVKNKSVRVLSLPTIIEREERIEVFSLAEEFVMAFGDKVTEEIDSETGEETTPVGEELTEEVPVETQPLFEIVTVKEEGPKEPVLMYTFLDEQTVLITTDIEAILEITTRLAEQQIFN